MHPKIHSILTSGILLAACSTSALALTLPISEDSSTSSNSFVAKSAGKATTLAASVARQALIRFEAGAFADSIAPEDVSKARLVLYISSVTAPGALTLHRITENWSENTASIPTYDPEPLATIPQSSVVAKQFVIIDVTAAVQGWLRAPGTDFGFAIVGSGGARVLLGAKEGPAAGHPAQLQIEASESGPIAFGDEADAALADEAQGAFTGRTRALAVLNSDLRSNSISGKKLKTNTVLGEKLFDGTITAAKLDPAIGLWTASGGNVSRGSGKVIVGGPDAIDTTSFTGLSLQYEEGSGEGAIMASYDDGTGYLAFYTKDPGSPITRRMTIDSDGQVGIGTTAPDGLLNLGETTGTQNNPDSGTLVLDHEDFGGASSIVFRSRANRGSDYGFIQYQDDFTIGGTGEAAVLTIGTSNDGDDHIALMPSGNVGIGISSPRHLLHVNGDYYGRGHVFLHAFEGDGQDGTAYLQARDDSGTSSIGMQIRTQNAGFNTDAIFISPTGNVGINDNTPTEGKLVVRGTGDRQPTQAKRYFNLNENLTVKTTSTSYSIWCDDWIASPEFHAYSDLRIKKVRGISDGAQDLKALLGIHITDYTFKDAAAMGDRPQKKVIAQQVEEVYPQAVSKSTSVVPDIYREATMKDGWIELTTDLKAGERVRLIGENEEALHEVLEVRDGAFRTAFRPSTEKVFVYGRQVEDFRSVDYDAIAMLNVSATQEVARKVESDSAEIARLRTVNTALAAKVAALEAKDKAREARLTRLESAVDDAAPRAVRASLDLK